MDARPMFDGDLHGFELASPSSPEAEAPQLKPVSTKWNSAPATGRWLADQHVGIADPKVRYRIDGWLAETGTSVWFGAGSTGKTQLMLWMAAMLASLPEDRPEQVWLGGRIHGTGHVLVLTAEDTREQIVGRLRDVVEHAMSQGAEAGLRTCARIHIMPFLSMREEEFQHPNPSLFQQNLKERHWETSDVMAEVRRYVFEWNRTHEVPEEKIIGVVMDSATSMSGFDSLDAQATTNFFFYLGRLCERLRIFWAVIGHTPKTTTMSRKTYRATAPSRLRGVAMWTTAPRLTVEVRLTQTWREGRRSVQEGQEHLDWLPSGWRADNLLVVYVAKANLKHASRSERFLARQRHGAFVDVTEMPDEALTNGSLAGWENEVDPAESDTHADEGARSASITSPPSSLRTSRGARPGRRKLAAEAFAPGTDLVLELIRETQAEGGRGGVVSANHLMTVLAGRRDDEPRARFVTTAYGGGKLPARPGAINWHLERLRERRILDRRGRTFHVADEMPGDLASPDGFV